MEKISAFGLSLLTFEGPLAGFSFLILSETGLTAFGLACSVLGAVLLLTPWNPVPEPPVRAMLEGSCINVEALLVEFDVENKAIYLPPKDGRVYTYVPLNPNPKDLELERIVEAPARVVKDAGGFRVFFSFHPVPSSGRNWVLSPLSTTFWLTSWRAWRACVRPERTISSK